MYITSFYSCKEPEAVGLDVLPGTDGLELIFSDTVSLFTQTVLEDSLRTDKISLQLLGSISDPVFGKHEAAIFSQVVLEGIPAFGTGSQADSLVLSILYSGHYGDTTVALNYKVYRMTEDMYFDSAYYSNRSFAYDASSPIGNLSLAPKPNTPVVVGNDTVSARMRIKLDQWLADSIMSIDWQTQITSNALWTNYFKGIHISTEPLSAGQAGNLSYLNFTGSKMILYYRDSSNTQKTYSFSLSSARSTRFSHDYTGMDLALQLADSNAVDSLCFVQAMSGVKSKISMPFLKHFLDSGSIVINKAELVLDVQTNSTGSYPPPAQLLLLVINENGESSFPADYFELPGYYGGVYDGTSSRYKFNVARQLQRFLDGRDQNYGFYLVPSGSSIQGNRVILNSPKNGTNPMKLNLYYTKIPK